MVLDMRPLFEVSVVVGEIEIVGGPAGAQRRVGPLTGGAFTGERLNGIVLPGGQDWQTTRSDGALLLDARTLLRTNDGATIGMTYEGIRRGATEVMARLRLGEDVDPSEYYFRVTARFATSAPRYEWLNGIIAIGSGRRRPGGPVYQLFELL